MTDKDLTRIDILLSIDNVVLFEKVVEVGGYKSLNDFIIRAAHEKSIEILKDHKNSTGIYTDSVKNWWDEIPEVKVDNIKRVMEDIIKFAKK